MQEETGATITIDEEDGVGKIQVCGANKAVIDAAVAKIRAIVAIPEVGEVYNAKVISIMPYGCFVEFMPGKEGLLHISEIAWKRLESVEEAGIKEGDNITVKLLEIDEKLVSSVSHTAFSKRSPKVGKSVLPVLPVVRTAKVVKAAVLAASNAYHCHSHATKDSHGQAFHS